MTAPGDFSSGNVLTAADMNGLPGGVMGYARNTSPPALTTSEQDYATVTFTAVSGRLYFVTGALLATTFNAAGVLGIRLLRDGNRIGESLFPAPSTSLDFVGGTVSGYFTFSGSTEIDLRAFVLAGATSASVLTTGEADPYLMVRDVGPS